MKSADWLYLNKLRGLNDEYATQDLRLGGAEELKCGASLMDDLDRALGKEWS